MLSYGVLKVIGAIGGFPVHRIHTIMGSGNFEVDVAPACSGAVPTSIYMAAVFAYPTSWRARWHRHGDRHRHHPDRQHLPRLRAVPDRPALPRVLPRHARLRGAGAGGLRRRGAVALLGDAVRRCACALTRGCSSPLLVVFLLCAYFAWKPVAPYYAQILLRASQVGMWLTEFSTDPNWSHPTQLLIEPRASARPRSSSTTTRALRPVPPRPAGHPRRMGDGQPGAAGAADAGDAGADLAGALRPARRSRWRSPWCCRCSTSSSAIKVVLRQHLPRHLQPVAAAALPVPRRLRAELGHAALPLRDLGRRALRPAAARAALVPARRQPVHRQPRRAAATDAEAATSDDAGAARDEIASRGAAAWRGRPLRPVAIRGHLWKCARHDSLG